MFRVGLFRKKYNYFFRAIFFCSNLSWKLPQVSAFFTTSVNTKKKNLYSILKFKNIDSIEVEEEINNLSIVKACRKDDLKVIKMNKDIFPVL